MIRESLKLTVAERFERLMALQRFAEEMQRAAQETRWQISPPPDSK